MADKIVEVPTGQGIGSAFKDFGVGALGGVIALVAGSIFGPLGLIAAPLLAGSMIPGDRGKTIAVVAGFMLIAGSGLLSGGGSQASSDPGDM